MHTTNSLDERKAAVREYIDSADDPAAARAFILECLDPVTDADLLLWIEETLPAPAIP